VEGATLASIVEKEKKKKEKIVMATWKPSSKCVLRPEKEITSGVTRIAVLRKRVCRPSLFSRSLDDTTTVSGERRFQPYQQRTYHAIFTVIGHLTVGIPGLEKWNFSTESLFAWSSQSILLRSKGQPWRGSLPSWRNFIVHLAC
jgi:hypothetical protein